MIMTELWRGQVTTGRDWFSDDALRKQDEVQRLKEAHEPVPVDLFDGMFEPRVPPTADECCHHCGLDARTETSGRKVGEYRWCVICLHVERHLKYEA